MTAITAARPGLADLPRDVPFTAARASELGITRRQLREWCGEGTVAPVLQGVYRVASLVDALPVRVAALRLVVPADCVVVDRTAAWLLGADGALAPGDHLEVPPVSLFRRPGYRLRRSAAASSERTLTEADICSMDGVACTTALRTATDLGRMLHKDQAYAAMNALARAAGLSADDLTLAATRYPGDRGVVQLRALAPLVDGRVTTPGESIALLRCHEAGLPRPVPQLAVPAPRGGSSFLDLAILELMLCVEYDGEALHTEAEREHDDRRRDWLRQQGWLVVVLRRDNVHGRAQDAEEILRTAHRDAVRRLTDLS